MNNQHRPSWDVDIEIRFGNPDYVLFAEWLYGNDSSDWWTALGDLLGGRPGWYCQLGDGGLYWMYGPMRSSMFNIGARPLYQGEDPDARDWSTFSVFDYEADTVFDFATIDELRIWLESNEPRYVDYLARPNWRSWVSGDNWSMLRSFPWTVKVAHVDGTWIGTVPYLPMAATFTSDGLPALLGQVRELITDAFGAPRAVAADLTLSAQLDEAATAALTV